MYFQQKHLKGGNKRNSKRQNYNMFEARKEKYPQKTVEFDGYIKWEWDYYPVLL